MRAAGLIFVALICFALGAGAVAVLPKPAGYPHSEQAKVLERIWELDHDDD